MGIQFVASGMPSERIERFYIHKNPRLRVNVNRSQGEGDVSLDSERLFAVCVARVIDAGMFLVPTLIFE